MSEFISTNIRLPEEYIKALKFRAIEEKKSMGALFREAISSFLRMGTPQKSSGKKPIPSSKDHPLLSLAGLGKSGIKDSATTHDQHLYGKSKTSWK